MFRRITLILIPLVLKVELIMPYSDFIHFDPLVSCHEDYKPEFCNLPNLTLSHLHTVEDFERCVPAVMPRTARNYIWSSNGRTLTYMWNMEAFRSIRILPRMMQDVSHNDLSTTVLGHRIPFPIGASPVAVQKLVDPEGELTTARAFGRIGSVMILSSFATSGVEEVSFALRESAKTGTHQNDVPMLWMQTYIFKDRQKVLDIVARAENAGAKALVVTVDSPVSKVLDMACGLFGYKDAMLNLKLPNLRILGIDEPDLDPSITFADISWLKSHTKLPIVAKGILRGDDAVAAARAGASAILVSNHGGREVDSAPSTIEVLPEIVEALKCSFPNVEVYMDGGIRNGWDVFKAIASGARAVFVGRPFIWGLAIGGEAGVLKVLNILKSEFNRTMLLAGINSPSHITSDSIRKNSGTQNFGCTMGRCPEYSTCRCTS